MPPDQPESNDQLDLEAHVRQIVEAIEQGGEDDSALGPEEPANAGPALAGHTVEQAVREILLEIGEDPEREGLVRTPERMHRMWLELTCGYRVDPERLINGAVFDVGYSEMVVIKGIPVLLAVRAPHAALLRHGGGGLSAARSGDRAVEDSARGRDVCAAAAGSGADDPADSRLPPAAPEPLRRGRGHRSGASLPGHAGSPKGRRDDGHEQRPGHVPHAPKRRATSSWPTWNGPCLGPE